MSFQRLAHSVVLRVVLRLKRSKEKKTHFYIEYLHARRAKSRKVFLWTLFSFFFTWMMGPQFFCIILRPVLLSFVSSRVEFTLICVDDGHKVYFCRKK